MSHVLTLQTEGVLVGRSKEIREICFKKMNIYICIYIYIYSFRKASTLKCMSKRAINII